jgi:phosphomannomutase
MLIQSISGIRGIIGGVAGKGLTPMDIFRFTDAYSRFILKKSGKQQAMVIVGRDSRSSGAMVSKLVCGTLQGNGINVIDLGMVTTPTAEVAVTGTGSDGGIVITASHNPGEWNALKLLNDKGEFISAADGSEILGMTATRTDAYPGAANLGRYTEDGSWLNKHVEMILALPLVNKEAIQAARFRVVYDAVNSVGARAIPALLDRLGVSDYTGLNTLDPGQFAHNPEPLPGHLQEIMARVVEEKANVGFAVDPDVDRLAVISEDGTYFGEEYTLVAVADYILQRTPGSAVSNLSSTKALKDVAERHGCSYYASPVGEVNVVEEMKARGAVIGGEGNGGVIYPQLHYGRDALVGIALFLSQLAASKMTCSRLRKSYPDYFMAKKKIPVTSGTDMRALIERVAEAYKQHPQTRADGLKIEFGQGWVHLRMSNTEPVIRVYAEGRSENEARALAGQVIEKILKD